MVRTDADGSFVELVAGGFRNAYDMAFNRDGDLFTFDSDMEWDAGLPWYRSTRMYHVTPGGEYGSRSGWSVMPDYALDALPAALEAGRGSPTGVEVYNHYAFPTPYHNAVFLCDWSQGRIIAVKTTPEGGTYKAQSGVFLEGRPLNVTDLSVGPDGWLYFCTGGRGTEGGVYRVVWTGKIDRPANNNPIVEALRQPQLTSAWSRQKIAAIQNKLGPAWAQKLIEAANDNNNRVDYRVRALDLMQLYGPLPDTNLLLRLSRAKPPELRAKVGYLLGLNVDRAAATRLEQMLSDPDPTVRRTTCEAIARGRYAVEPDSLVALLGDANRFVAWSARRALQRLPVESWQPQVLAAKQARVFTGGAAGLLPLDVEPATAKAVVERSREFLKGYLADEDFIDLLRVMELALLHGKLTGEDVPELRADLANEYPASEPRMNRELVRLLCYLQESTIIPRLVAELKSNISDTEKLHLVFSARFLKSGWTTEQKLAVLEYFEQARSLDGGHSMSGYIENVSRDFFTTFTDAERQTVLADGIRWPSAALSVLATVPEKVTPEMVGQLIELDEKLPAIETPAARNLQTGIAAVLGNNKDEVSLTYLRGLFDKHPERRAELAMALAQSPDGDNFPLLVRSLPIVEGIAAQEVLVQLGASKSISTDSEPLRQVILCGLKLGKEGGQHAVALLTKWAGKQVSASNAPVDEALADWQKWFAETFPDAPPAVLPIEPEGSKWTFQELVALLDGEEALHGEANRGVQVFEKAQCVKCHRHGTRGETIGPDLSTVGQRFQKKEILESTLFPSQVISDQYASKVVTTVDGLTYTGMVGAAGAEAIVMLQPNGEKVTIKKSQIAEVSPSKKSAMPEGLLNQLTAEEIADLFAYLTGSGTQRR